MGEDCSLDAFEEAMDGVDKIDLPKDFDEECPCFDYLYRKLKGGEYSNWLCEIVKGVDASDNYTMQIKVGNYSSIQHQVPTGSTNRSTMVIPESLCNLGANGNKQQKLEASAKFIHEFLHAHFYTLISDAYPDGGFKLEGGSSTWSSAEWDKLIRAKYAVPDGTPVNGNHHADFFTFLKNSIMQGLYDMNGGQGDISQYEYYAHVILNTQDLASKDSPYALSLGLRDSEDNLLFNLDSYKNAWDTLNFNPGC